MESPRKRPVIYIVDASIDVTGAFLCARNEARVLKDVASIKIALPENSRIPAEALAPFDGVLRLRMARKPRSIGEFVRFFFSLVGSSWQLRQALCREHAVTLQVNDFYLLYGLLVRAFGYSGRVVTWVRIDPHLLGRVVPFVLLSVARLVSSEVVVVSQFIRSRVGRKRGRLIYDVFPAPVGNTEEYQTPARRIVVFIGNYIIGKGQSDAISAFASVSNRFPDAELHFFGGDMGLTQNVCYKRDLLEQVERLNLTGRVRLHGFIHDPGEALSRATCALMLSQSESFSLTCLEALSHRCPVIATRCGGPEEIVEDGLTGYLVEVGDVPEIARAMARLLGDPLHAAGMGREGARRVRQKFSEVKFAKEVRDVLRV